MTVVIIVVAHTRAVGAVDDVEVRVVDGDARIEDRNAHVDAGIGAVDTGNRVRVGLDPVDAGRQLGGCFDRLVRLDEGDAGIAGEAGDGRGRNLGGEAFQGVAVDLTDLQAVAAAQRLGHRPGINDIVAEDDDVAFLGGRLSGGDRARSGHSNQRDHQSTMEDCQARHGLFPFPAGEAGPVHPPRPHPHCTFMRIMLVVLPGCQACHTRW